MALQPSVDTDSWWHLRSGAWILENGEILKTDPFSLTRQGQSWEYPGWIAQIILYLIFRQFSFAGLNIFTAVMVFIAFVFVWATLEGRGLLKAFVILLAAATSGLYWSARPQIITFALTGITIYLLESAKRGEIKRLWMMPIIMTFWVNIHGGFAIGFLLIALYFISAVIEILLEKFRTSSPLSQIWQSQKQFLSTLILIGIVCVLTSMINPLGPKILLYPFKTISIGTLQEYISEWQPPNFHSTQVQPFILLLFLTFFALSLSNRKRETSDFLIVGLFGYLSLIAVRNVSLFALAAAPVLSRNLDSSLQPIIERFGSRRELPERLANSLNLLLAILISFAAFLQIILQLPDEVNIERTREQIPLDAFEYLRENKPSGPLFNSYNWGGYVLWDLHPSYLSFVDGRTDLFQDEILDEYIRAWIAEPGWEEILEKWEIRLVLLETSSPLSKALISSDWEVAFEDEQAIIMMRDIAKP
jgi:hypothetical protein